MGATLVIMAAGMGSRFGGLKQIEPIGKNGEILMEYAIHDAKKAGFDKVICIIKKENEEDFQKHVGDRISKMLPLKYVYQQLDKLPEGSVVPEGRTKPWGTAHAVMCCIGEIDQSFCVINADDYYGYDAYEKCYNFLNQANNELPYECCMAGFRVENTLTEHGHVSRGICTTDENSMLTSIIERSKLQRVDGVITDLETDIKVEDGSFASMNFWGFPLSVLGEFEALFPEFLKQNEENLQKCEFYLPYVVDVLISKQKAQVSVLPVEGKWFGITYREDRELLSNAIAQLTESGAYPSRLW